VGYTHYFPQQRYFTIAEWDQLRHAVRSLIGANKVPLAIEYDEPNTPPQADGGEIRFNGVGDGGHETFVLTRSHDSSFNFCKTAHKPYDLIVTAVLCLANTIAPGALKISSDGEPSEWAAGHKLAKSIWDDSVICPIGKRKTNPVAGYVAGGLGEENDFCPSDNG
jgi:hypothetical protein